MQVSHHRPTTFDHVHFQVLLATVYESNTLTVCEVMAVYAHRCKTGLENLLESLMTAMIALLHTSMMAVFSTIYPYISHHRPECGHIQFHCFNSQ